MKKEKIKALPVVKAYADYFVCRAKRILKLKNSEFEAIHIDLHDFLSIDVWFFLETKIVARVLFALDGQQKDKDSIIDNRIHKHGRKKY